MRIANAKNIQFLRIKNLRDSQYFLKCKNAPIYGAFFLVPLKKTIIYKKICVLSAH